MSTRGTASRAHEGARPTGALGVVLIDSPQVVRAGIALLVSGQEDMEVLAEAGHAEEALEKVARLRRRKGVVAVVGLTLSGEHDAFWLMRALREQFPSMPLVATGSKPDDSAISRALFCGADGFVDKDARPAEFLDAIRKTAEGEVVLAGVPEKWLGKIAQGVAVEPLPRVLTERELEVLSVATQGLTARQIGTRLGVRERTVTTHLSRIYKKLGAGSRVAAIAAAARSGLVSVGGRP